MLPKDRADLVKAPLVVLLDLLNALFQSLVRQAAMTGEDGLYVVGQYFVQALEVLAERVADA